jgi:phosphonate transport system ATP-binding protein
MLREVDAAPPGLATPVLSKVTLAVAPGECVALVGSSGAGKTTLLRTIAGLIPPLGGIVRLRGEDLSQLRGRELRRARSRIGMIAQKHDLVEPLRVDKNVMAGALGRWSTARALRFLVRPTREELAEAEAALAAVGLRDKLRQRTAKLSGGEQQRVAIARALIQAPALLLADEPVASLDPQAAEGVLSLLTGLARERGMALIAALHQPELAERFCDRVVELRDGEVVEQRRAAGSPHGAR